VPRRKESGVGDKTTTKQHEKNTKVKSGRVQKENFRKKSALDAHGGGGRVKRKVKEKTLSQWRQKKESGEKT